MPKWAIHQRLYHWVLSWAERPHAMVAMGVLAFLESFFLPVPLELLLIPLVLGHRKNWWKFALITAVFSVVGGTCGHLLGRMVGGPLEGLVQQMNPKAWAAAEAASQEHGFAAILVAGWTPIPYNLFSIASGCLKMDYGSFLIASLASRFPRFFIEAALFWYFGHRIKPWIDRWFNWICIGLVVLVIGVIYVPKLFGGGHPPPETPATQPATAPAELP